MQRDKIRNRFAEKQDTDDLDTGHDKSKTGDQKRKEMHINTYNLETVLYRQKFKLMLANN